MQLYVFQVWVICRVLGVIWSDLGVIWGYLFGDLWGDLSSYLWGDLDVIWGVILSDLGGDFE